MQKLILYLLIGASVAILSVVAMPQEVTMYAGRGQVATVGGDSGPPGIGNEQEGEGNDELQDEAELASALGVDRRALYEDLMRIQEELGGSPLSPLPPGAGGPPGPGPFNEQNTDNSQENEDDY